MNSSAEPSFVGRRSRWFEPAGIGKLSPGGKLITYFFLLLWAFVVLFPIYWLLITAFKLPPDVNNGPTFDRFSTVSACLEEHICRGFCRYIPFLQ
jgi:ABC-type glycerol-3-phosphate transport system permease component